MPVMFAEKMDLGYYKFMTFYQQAIAHLDGGIPSVLVVVLHTWGVVPCRVGRKVLVGPNGAQYITLGSQFLDVVAQEQALLALETRQAHQIAVNLEESGVMTGGRIFTGRVRLFVAPLGLGNRTAYCKALKASRDGERGTLITVLVHPAYSSGTVMWLPEGAAPLAGMGFEDVETTGEHCAPHLIPEHASPWGDVAMYFVEPLCPASTQPARSPIPVF